MHIPTLQHYVAVFEMDRDSIAASITTLTQQLAQGQTQLGLLHGAREYNTLALKRAQETLATAQASVTPTT